MGRCGKLATGTRTGSHVWPRLLTVAIIVVLQGCALADAVFGDAPFELESTVIPVDGTAGGVAIADFDGDRRGDVGFTQTTGGVAASVFRLRFDGTFERTGLSSLGSALRRVQPGDFDGDGNIDMVGTTTGVGGVIVLRGMGNGQFTESGLVSLGESDDTFLAVGAIGPDLRDDVAVAVPSEQRVQVLRSGADGQLEPAESYDTTANLSSAIIAPGDGDAIADVIWYSADGVHVVEAEEGGALADAASIAAALGGTPVALVAAHLDSDAAVDLVAATRGNGVEVVGLIFGAGGFIERSRIGRTALDSVAVGDVDGDGHVDVVGISREKRSVGVMFGAPDGVLGELQDVSLTGTPSSLAVGDLDEDGRADIAVVVEGGIEVLFFRP